MCDVDTNHPRQSVNVVEQPHVLELENSLTQYMNVIRKDFIFKMPNMLYPDSGISMDEGIVLGDMIWSNYKGEL